MLQELTEEQHVARHSLARLDQEVLQAGSQNNSAADSAAAAAAAANAGVDRPREVVEVVRQGLHLHCPKKGVKPALRCIVLAARQSDRTQIISGSTGRG